MITKIPLRSPTIARTFTASRLIRHSSSLALEVKSTISNANTALARAQRVNDVASQAPPTDASTPLRSVDPFKLLASDLADLRTDLLSLVPSSQPELTSIARYYFESSGKHLRPVLILLFAKAANGLASGWGAKCGAAVNADPEALNRPLSPPDVLTDFNPVMAQHTEFPPLHVFSPHAWQHSAQQVLLPSSFSPLPITTAVLPTQRRLAQITEMIHVASLLHDDVIDKSATRRSRPSAPAAFGNKLSILGGDFLLARASAALARLGDLEVVELVSSMINNLVEGEVVQIEEVFGGAGEELTAIGPDTARWNQYLKKTYLKTASLMAKSARASVVLGGARSEGADPALLLSDKRLKDIAYSYGRNIGIAFQVSTSPVLHDGHLLVLSACRRHARLQHNRRARKTLGWCGHAARAHNSTCTVCLGRGAKDGRAHCEKVRRYRRCRDGKHASCTNSCVSSPNIPKARSIVASTSALERTRDLALSYSDAAREAIQQLPESEARLGLETLCDRVVARTK